jgi:hypothetical protein
MSVISLAFYFLDEDPKILSGSLSIRLVTVSSRRHCSPAFGAVLSSQRTSGAMLSIFQDRCFGNGEYFYYRKIFVLHFILAVAFYSLRLINLAD